jgi:hypothetical protein
MRLLYLVILFATLDACSVEPKKVKEKETIVTEQVYLKSAIKTQETLKSLQIDRQRFALMNLELPKELIDTNYQPLPPDQYRDTIRKYETAIRKYQEKYDSLEMELKKY